MLDHLILSSLVLMGTLDILDICSIYVVDTSQSETRILRLRTDFNVVKLSDKF